MSTTFRSSVIPSAFRLAGFKVDVHVDDTLISRENHIGYCRFKEQEIWIDPGIGSVPFAERFYLCQLITWIFFVMGEYERADNNRLLDGFSHYLYQALTTMEFPSSDEDELPGDEPFWDESEEVDYDPGCNDYDPHADARELAQMEWEEEEDERRIMQEEAGEWSGYADSWARSEDEGWFYDDED